MNYLEDPVRKQIIAQALSARTMLQVDAATRELNRWIIEHPHDTGIQWAFEQMALVELAIREIASTPDMEALTTTTS